MHPSIKTRKPANKLTPQDLSAFPAWEFALDEEGVDGQDESWVRPVLHKSIRARSYSQLVPTKFVTSSGKEIDGYLVVTPARSTPKELAHSGGAIVTEQEQAFLAKFDGKMSSSMKQESLRKIIALLGLQSKDVFPLRFKLLTAIEGEVLGRTGFIAGPTDA